MVSFKNAATAAGVAATALLLHGCGGDECKDFDSWVEAALDSDCAKCYTDKASDCVKDCDNDDAQCIADCPQKAAEDCGFDGSITLTVNTNSELAMSKMLPHSQDATCYDCITNETMCMAEANTAWVNNNCVCQCDRQQKDPKHCRSCPEIECCEDPNATWHPFTETCYCTWDPSFDKNQDTVCPDGGDICARDENATWNPLTKTCSCTYDPQGKVGECKSAQEWQCSQDVNAEWDSNEAKCKCKYDDDCDTVGSCPTQAESECDKDPNATWNPMTHVCSCIYDAQNEYDLKNPDNMCPSAERIKCAKDPNALWNAEGEDGFKSDCGTTDACICMYDTQNGVIGQCPSVEKACLVNHGTWDSAAAVPEEQCKCAYVEGQFFNGAAGCPSPPQVLCDADVNATWNPIDETCKCTHGIGKLGFCPSKEEIACNHDQFAQWNAVSCSCKCLWDAAADPAAGPCPSPELKNCQDDTNATWDVERSMCYCTFDPTCGDIGNCPSCDMVECAKNPLAFWDKDFEDPANDCPGQCRCIYDEAAPLNECPSADFQKCKMDPEAIWQWNGVKYSCVCKNDKYCNKKGVIGNCPSEKEAKCLSDELADWDGANCACKYDPEVDPTETGEVCPTKQYVCEQDCNATWDASCAKECYCTHDPHGDVFKKAKPGSCPSAEDVCSAVETMDAAGNLEVAAVLNATIQGGVCKCTDDVANSPGKCRSLQEICEADASASWADPECTCNYWDFNAEGIGKNIDDDLEQFGVGSCPTEDYVCAIDPFASWKVDDATGESNCVCDHDPVNKPGACRCLQEVCEEDPNADYNKVANTCMCKYNLQGTPGSCMSREEFMCNKDVLGTWDAAAEPAVCNCSVGSWNSEDGKCVFKCRDVTTDEDAEKATDCHSDEMCGDFGLGSYQCVSLRCEEANSQDQADHAHNCGFNQSCVYDAAENVGKCQ